MINLKTANYICGFFIKNYGFYMHIFMMWCRICIIDIKNENSNFSSVRLNELFICKLVISFSEYGILTCIK